MLHFSKLRIIFIFFTTLFFILISSSNFFQSENFFLKKKINLGLDLQGGSYLLLEIDNNPVILQKLQTKVSAIKSLFKENNIKISDLRISNNNIKFNILEKKQINEIINFFDDDES